MSNQNQSSREIDQVQAALHDGIENSREMVRQSRMLLQLSETDGPVYADNDNSAD